MSMIDRIKEFIEFIMENDVIKELAVDYMVLFMPALVIALADVFIHFNEVQKIIAGIVYIVIESAYFFWQGEKLEREFPDSC